MRNPLIIAGNEIERNPFQCVSPFYPGYAYQVANAGPLDVASAIGAARQADRGTLANRTEWLRRAAAAISYDRSDLEHTVRLTGAPVSQVAELLADIPHILRQVSAFLEGRFTRLGVEDPHQAEIIARGQ
jgi:acyl-CoA reductase-like NAD-dependent aldehyde dehydrogenase